MIHREIDEDTFTSGAITADYEAVQALTDRIADIYEQGTEIRMTTAAGTNLQMTKKDRPVLRLGGLLRGATNVAVLPTGEAAFPPTPGRRMGPSWSTMPSIISGS